MQRRGSRVLSTQATPVTRAKRMGIWNQVQRAGDDNLEQQLRASIAQAKDKAMEETAAIVRAEPVAQLAPTIPEAKYQLLRETYAKGCTDLEFQLFVDVCNRLGLDPFRRQIYAVKRWDPELQREVMQAQPSIDGMRVKAQRTGRYAGQSDPEWCGPDGIWKDVWLAKTPPSAARVRVYRTDWNHHSPGIALYNEYVQTRKDGSPTKFWRTMPSNQLAKCAEAQALRKAFPDELSGVYASEEMDQADNETPAPRAVIQAHTTSAGTTAAPKPAPAPAPAAPKPPPPPAAVKQQAQAQAEMREQVEAPRFSLVFPVKAWADKPMRAAPIEILVDYIAWCELVMADQRRKHQHKKAEASKALAEAIYQEAASFEMHRVVDAEENTAPIQPSDLRPDHIATGLQAEYDRMHRAQSQLEDNSDSWVNR